MANFKLIYDRPSEPAVYLCGDDEIAMTDDQINAELPNAAPGTIITTAGFQKMKMVGFDGAWAEVKPGAADDSSSDTDDTTPSDDTEPADGNP